MANDTKYGYLISPAPQFLDTNGRPLSGGRLKVYIAGTTTKATTYSDWNLTKNTWPVVLDAMGTCQVIVSSAELYKFVLESAEGEEPLVTRDNVAVAYANVDITGIGSEVVNSDGSVDVTATTDPDTGRTTYDVSVKDTVQDLEGLIEDETDRATAAEKAAKTEIVAGDNITVTKTVGANGQDVYTIDGEAGDNLVEDVRVNGASVVTDKVANIDVPVAGTASPHMDGTASAGASGKYAREDHVHPSDTSREAVANKTTVVLGTSESKYPTDKAVWNFVNSSIATNTAYYISDNGEPFTSVEELEAYSGTVTNNDYAFVTGTDSAGNTYYDRYKATVRDSTVTWALEYRLNNSSFTAAQWAAINSGITAALVAKIHDHANKAVLDGITATDVSNWNNKMPKQTAGNASTPIYLNNGTATACGTLTGRVASSRIYADTTGFYKILSIVRTTDPNKGGVIVPWISRSSTYPFQGELHICTTGSAVTTWGNNSYNLFFSNNDHATRPQFYIAANDTNGIDIYARLMSGYSTFAWAPTATGQDVTYYKQRVDALPEDAVQLTDRVNASLPAWSVGSASTPVYFENGVAKEATDVSGKANEVIAAALNEINARLESVEDRENFGDLVAETVSMQEFPLVGGKSMVLFGSSSPDSAPSYAGQLYLDLTNKNLYFSVGQSSASDWVLAKKKQSAVTLNGSTIKTVTRITQDANGTVGATFEDIQSASTTQKGVVQLSDSTASASSETAATSAAVKQAYDLAASKQEAITWMTDAEALQLWTDAWNAAT